ncbi:hypothetical protein BD626DRAFT_628827 [Schizophyllum amplum]|uniref:SnoaL-like domain-containing protein n=1 Tax=Schizophyllum amplum TaxID=97359 RepID=A0A550CIQ2_9AGAR|nr:hypothetical protein BD626DRAFT_628827 [Auriculariopsis ampla]
MTATPMTATTMTTTTTTATPMPTTSSPAAYAALQAKAFEWMEKFQAANDTLDAAAWIDAFWTPDCVLQFAGAPEVAGRGVLVEMFTAQWALVESMKHRIVSLDVRANKIYVRATVTVRVKGDPKEHGQITMPGFMVVFFPGDLGVDEDGQLKVDDGELKVDDEELTTVDDGELTTVDEELTTVDEELTGTATATLIHTLTLTLPLTLIRTLTLIHNLTLTLIHTVTRTLTLTLPLIHTRPTASQKQTGSRCTSTRRPCRRG